jgi:hypothetical protein
MLIGADVFKDTGHNRCVMYMSTVLHTHIILQGYIELGFIAHP